MKKRTRGDAKRPETPEPPQIMHPNSPRERKVKKQDVKPEQQRPDNPASRKKPSSRRKK